MHNPARSNDPECKMVSWITDFQHKFYPDFFSKKNLLERETRIKQILGNSDAIILSSHDAYSHLKKFYKVDDKKIKVHIMPFVSMIQDFALPDFDTLKNRYNITTPYFLVSNQFYAHKNHIVVLKAIAELKKTGLSFTVYFTGKTDDYRNPLFYSSLTDYIAENNIQSHAKILGIIPREDQLSLLKNAIATIQPSKFEGWSTIIEDAKTLQRQIICSNIDVHVEQLGENAFYFNPDSVDELSKHIVMFLQNKNAVKPVFDNYNERIERFANEFLNAF
jgi:glycosyltransferase involved in cell wall biosynthesis